MTIFIKDLISQHSQNLVKEILVLLGLNIITVTIGEVKFKGKLSLKKYNIVNVALRKNDFELLNDKDIILLEQIKSIVIGMIHYPTELPGMSYSKYISKKLHINYTYLSKFFSKLKKITIEEFIIIHKIERAKQLLFYGELNLSEIAVKLNYSSTAHLSNQFKKVTGNTPSFFKKAEVKNFIPFEDM